MVKASKTDKLSTIFSTTSLLVKSRPYLSMKNQYQTRKQNPDYWWVEHCYNSREFGTELIWYTNSVSDYSITGSAIKINKFSCYKHHICIIGRELDLPTYPVPRQNAIGIINSQVFIFSCCSMEITEV